MSGGVDMKNLIAAIACCISLGDPFGLKNQHNLSGALCKEAV